MSKTIIVCKKCDWFVTDPRDGKTSLNKNRPVIDNICPNCGQEYSKTGSKIEKIDKQK